MVDLVKGQPRAKLTDFGFANFASLSDFSKTLRRSGAAWYKAPELMMPKTREITKKSDVFSFGLVCWKVPNICLCSAQCYANDSFA